MKLALQDGKGGVRFVDGTAEVWRGPKNPREFGVSILTAQGMAGFILNNDELRLFIEQGLQHLEAFRPPSDPLVFIPSAGKTSSVLEELPRLQRQQLLEEQTKRLGNTLGSIVRAECGQDVGFMFTTFNFGDRLGSMAYVSNADRTDVIQMLRELADKLEGKD